MRPSQRLTVTSSACRTGAVAEADASFTNENSVVSTTVVGTKSFGGSAWPPPSLLANATVMASRRSSPAL